MTTSLMIDKALAILGSDCVTRTQLRASMNVHRNTWARHEKKAIEAGLIERVGGYKLRAVHPSIATPTAQPPSIGGDILRVLMAEARALIQRLESLMAVFATTGGAWQLAYDAPHGATVAPLSTRDAPLLSEDAPQIAPKAPLLAEDAPKAPPSAPKVVHPSRAHADSFNCLQLPALRQAGLTRAHAREPLAEESQNAQKWMHAKMKRFRSVWRQAWREELLQQNAPRCHALWQPEIFKRYKLDEIDVDDFRERLQRFFEDRKATEHRWPVGWFLSGLHSDYLYPKDEDEDIDTNDVIDLVSVEHQAMKQAPSKPAKEPNKASFRPCNQHAFKYNDFLAQTGIEF